MADRATDQVKPIPSSPDCKRECGGDASVAVAPSEKQPSSGEGLMSCYVNGGSLVTFPTATTKQRQQDIQYSLLFAQLAADKGYSREVDPQGWFTYFQYIIRNIGWVLTNLKFDVDVSDGYFVFSSMVLNLMTKNGRATKDIATFRRFFNALHSLPDTDPSIEVLYGKIYDQKTYATSLILCSFKETPDKEAQLDIVMIGFGGLTEEAYRYLFHVYNSEDVTFDEAESCSMVLNEEVFEKVRESIVEKLGDKIEMYIKEVELPSYN